LKSKREKDLNEYCSDSNQKEQVCSFLLANYSENNTADNIVNEEITVNANKYNTITTINKKSQVSFFLFYFFCF